MKPRVTRPRLRGLLAAAAVGIALPLSGCQSLSPQTTELHYDAADGVSATVGEVSLNDVLIVTTGDNAAGEVYGMATNNSQAAQSLRVALDGAEPATLEIPAATAVRLDGKTSGNSTATAGPVKLASVKARVGDTVTLQFAANGSGVVSVQVPVLLDQYPYGSATVEHTGPIAPPSGEGEHGGH